MRIILLLIALMTSFSLFALVEEDLLIASEYDLIKTDVRKKMDAWDVNPSKLDKDEFKFKDQARDTTDWSKLNAYVWLDFNIWLKETINWFFFKYTGSLPKNYSLRKQEILLAEKLTNKSF